MSTLQWKDISSYSHTDTERVPHSFQIWIGLVRLVVTRKLQLEGWYIDAPPFIISRRCTRCDREYDPITKKQRPNWAHNEYGIRVASPL